MSKRMTIPDLIEVLKPWVRCSSPRATAIAVAALLDDLADLGLEFATEDSDRIAELQAERAALRRLVRIADSQLESMFAPLGAFQAVLDDPGLVDACRRATGNPPFENGDHDPS